jgi:uncharacterized protein (TIGR02246 family)
MRRLLSVVLALSIAPTLIAGPAGYDREDIKRHVDQRTPETGDEYLFRRLANEWKDAYNSKDPERLAALYAEDADYISSHVPGLVARGRASIRANFQKGIEAGGHVDAVRILTSRISCDLAYLVSVYEATNNGQKVSGRNLIALRKLGGKWLIVSHMTVVPE